MLSSATIQNPTFVADLPGNYVVQLIVNDGIQSSTPSMVTITTTNTAPVANPGLNQAVPVPANVSLDGSGSSDADNDPLTYAWSFSSRPPGSSAALSSLTAVRPTFLADVTGTYVVQLIVNDGFANSSPVTVTITAGVKAITLSPNPLNLSTNTPGTLTLTLGSVAGPGGQIVFLDSSDGTIASVPANVTVPEGLGGVNVTILAGSGAGSTTITALASGFTPGFATINVTPPTVKVTLSANTIGLTRTANGTITLNSPAPTGGVSVSLSDPSGFVTFQPATVPIAAGATSATFTATGAAVGSTTILAIAPGYNTGTASVTVAMLGAITLLPNVTVGPGQSVPFPVSLVTGAPVGGATIDLVSSDTSRVTISPASVTIAQGQTTPAQQPTVTGVNIGSADISASAPGFFGDKKTVQVAANITFLQQTLTVGVNGTQELTLNFSGQAPAGGLTINLSSTNPSVATVPTTVTIAATKSSVTVPVTGIGVGASVIHASAPGLAETTATVNVVNVGAIGLPANQTVGLGASIPFPISLPSPAPAGGVTVTLASSDTSKVTISAASVTIAGGQTTPPVQPTVTGVSFGTATINATASGYTSASSQVQVATIMSFASPTVSITGLTTQTVALNLSAGAPAGGLTVNLTSSNTNVVTVPASVSFAANSTSANVLLTAVGPGTATITAASVTPGIANATTSVTVSTGSNTGAIILPASGALGLGVTAPFPVSITSPATAPITIALASSDSSKVTLSLASVTIAIGQTTPPVQPTVTGVNFGTANILATASGFTPASSSVQVNATVVFSPPSLTLSAGTQNLTLNAIGGRARRRSNHQPELQQHGCRHGARDGEFRGGFEYDIGTRNGGRARSGDDPRQQPAEYCGRHCRRDRSGWYRSARQRDCAARAADAFSRDFGNTGAQRRRQCIALQQRYVQGHCGIPHALLRRRADYAHVPSGRERCGFRQLHDHRYSEWLRIRHRGSESDGFGQFLPRQPDAGQRFSTTKPLSTLSTFAAFQHHVHADFFKHQRGDCAVDGHHSGKPEQRAGASDSGRTGLDHDYGKHRHAESGKCHRRA